MGCSGYRDQPCECEDGGLKQNPYTGALFYVPDDEASGEKTLVCHRCNCLTDEKVYVHLDKNLLGPEGTSGTAGV